MNMGKHVSVCAIFKSVEGLTNVSNLYWPGTELVAISYNPVSALPNQNGQLSGSSLTNPLPPSQLTFPLHAQVLMTLNN